MADTKYILRYLPLFYEELEEKVVYIAETLKNPQDANEFLELSLFLRLLEPHIVK
ncbi:MAG: hypothetical protein K2M78_04185 [Lachnospiraceae bacterium]|nr:hypothetical protein [Lachnospiraceae bacterium]